jgi:hypothetical protein
MQHFEQAFFACSAVLLSLLPQQKLGAYTAFSLRWAGALLAGVVAGKALLSAILYVNDIDPASGRLAWLQEFWPFIVGQFGYHFQTILWSVLGLGWLIVIKFVEQGRRAVPFAVCLVALLCLAPVSGDQTRVISIVTFPLLAVHVLLNDAFLQRVSRQFVAMIGLLWLLLPWAWVWGGKPRGSAFSFDLAWLLHGMFGWFEVPSDASAWPF